MIIINLFIYSNHSISQFLINRLIFNLLIKLIFIRIIDYLKSITLIILFFCLFHLLILKIFSFLLLLIFLYPILNYQFFFNFTPPTHIFIYINLPVMQINHIVLLTFNFLILVLVYVFYFIQIM